MLHHDVMTIRAAIALVVGSIAIAACGSGDDATPTSVEVTLVTTTTTEPVFVPVDSAAPVDANDANADADGSGAGVDEPVTTEVVATDVSTTSVPAPVGTESASSVPTATDPAPPTTDPVAEANFTLDVNGLGSALFGADPEGTIGFVSSFLGEPTGDTGWVDPFSIGPCGGTELRQVDWGQLRLEFGDVSSVRQDRPHFYAYTYGAEGSLGAVVPPGLSTPLGITAGSRVEALIEAYPTVELRSADEFIAANFFVNANFSGRMSGLADDDVVEVIIGGVPCVG
jgi:hypothetical protein